MKTNTLPWLSIATLSAVIPLGARLAAGRSGDEALLKALAGSKHSLTEGIQQVSKAPETAISAKFELEDGKLSLSVYTAEKGLGAEADHNVLKEHAGNPEEAAWKPEAEVFKDVEHVARASEHLTLAALAPSTLADVVKKAEKDQPGTVYSVTPALRERKAVFVVLVADKGKPVELVYDLLTGSPVKPVNAGAPKK